MMKALARTVSYGCSALALSVCLAGASNAQTLQPAGAVAGQDQSSSTGAAPAVAAAEQGIADIVVTAERRSETLQRVAIPVSAVSGGTLAAAGVSDVTTLSRLIPALVVQPGLGSTTNFYLRGVGSFAANAFGENPIAFNFNGVYIGRPAAPLGTFYDLDRVEVLKGPQGTLYGRNATGGAINAIPARPTFNGISGDLLAEYGNYDSKKIQGAINLALSSTIAIRVAGQALEHDAYLSDGYDQQRGAAARVSILLQPSTGFSAYIVADYAKFRERGTGAVLVPGALTPDAPDPKRRIGGADPRSLAALARDIPSFASGLAEGPRKDGYNHGEFWGISPTFQVDLGFGDVTIQPAYRESRPDYLSYNNGYSARNNELDKQFSGEARLSSKPGSRLKYVLGAFYYHEDERANSIFTQGRINLTNLIFHIRNKSLAGFGQATYSVTDRLRIVGGARYTHEQKNENSRLLNVRGAPIDLRNNPTGNYQPLLGRLSFNKATWKAGVEYDLAPRSLAYATVATGFKSGGFFSGISNNTFRPEKLTAYTIGVKNRFLDNRLQLNVEGFYWKYDDQQVNYVGVIQVAPGVFGPGAVTANAGNSRIYGAEAEFQYQFTPNDRFGGDLQYLNTKYVDFNFQTFSASGALPRNACAIGTSTAIPLNPPARIYSVDCSGRSIVNAPKWSATVSYEHRFDLGTDYHLSAGARTRVESARYLSLEYLPEERQKGYMTSDLWLSLTGPREAWSLTAFVNNVEDRTLYTGSAIVPVVGAIYNVLSPPRLYGIRGSVHF